jgi:adenine/guanine phosphoribosyltransferase-like PRPP-binding protein
MGGTRLAELDIDRDFFKDSFVLLFDDIVTQGITAANRKSLIEAAGGRCIGIISLGRTV